MFHGLAYAKISQFEHPLIIDKDILRFDVPMSYRQHVEVVKSPEDLVGIDFDQKRVDFLLLDVDIVSKLKSFQFQGNDSNAEQI